MTDERYGDEMTRRLHATDDAMVWAVEWCEVAEYLSDRGWLIIDEDWMVGWFANAMETAKRIERERRRGRFWCHGRTPNGSRGG